MNENITAQQIADIAKQADRNGQMGIATVLYLLAAMVRSQQEDDLAIYLLPLIKSIQFDAITMRAESN